VVNHRLLESTELPLPSKYRRPRSRFTRGLLLLLILGILVVTGFYVHRSVGAINVLRDTLAVTDGADSAWRLVQLEARRFTPDDKENAALHILAALKLLGADGSASPQCARPPEAVPPQVRLPAPQVKALRADLARASAALAEARQLKNFPRGRFPTFWASNWTSSKSHAQETLAVANLLSCDVLLLAEDKEMDRALGSCHALLYCGRAIGEELRMASQFASVACRSAVVQGLERILAQGEPSVDALRAWQVLLEDEETERPLLNALRGERAGCDWLLERVQAGAVPMEEALRREESLAERLDLHCAGGIHRHRAALLRYLNRAIQIAVQPVHEQIRPLRSLEATAHDLPNIARRLAPPLLRMAAADWRSRAQLRCARVALAAERYRRRNGDWPAGLDVLVARGYLKEEPADPYDGAALRWRRLKDGVVIYSVGLDGADDGGTPNSHDPGTEDPAIRFHLWDSEHRRQPPPAQRAAADSPRQTPP
jgi:hypothetical protein